MNKSRFIKEKLTNAIASVEEVKPLLDCTTKTCPTCKNNIRRNFKDYVIHGVLEGFTQKIRSYINGLDEK